MHPRRRPIPFQFKALMWTVYTVAISLLVLVHAQEGNRYMPNIQPVTIDSSEGRGRLSKTCSPFYRTYEGTCTNDREKMFGSVDTPLYNYESHNFDASRPSGDGLKSPREISNIVSHQFENVIFDDEYALSEFTTFMGQFIDHQIVGTSTNMTNDLKIPISPYDPIECIFEGLTLSFDRTMKGGTRSNSPWARAINCLSSALDLFGTYGKEDLVAKLRLKRGGLMRTSSGNLLPLNGKHINHLMNAPKRKTLAGRKKFFVAGDHRTNENPVLTSIHTLFMREHNRIAKELNGIFPTRSDFWLFNNAREVNIARFQKIVFEEYYPVMTRRTLPECKDNCFKSGTDPSISDLFSTAAFRVGHSMVGPTVTKVTPDLRHFEEEVRNMFFVEASMLKKEGIEVFLRGAFRNQAQKIDMLVSSSLRNHLFKDVKEEAGFDLVALNLQRSRDHNIPRYNKVREFFWKRTDLPKKARTWADITSDTAMQDRLKQAYDNVNSVEAWVGLMAEDHHNGPMGHTLQEIWEQEFLRMRDGDRFFYKNKARYLPELWNMYKPLRDMVEGRGDYSMKRLILDNTNIKESEMPQGGINVPWEVHKA